MLQATVDCRLQFFGEKITLTDAEATHMLLNHMHRFESDALLPHI
jgi:hypothetical protein